jgi:hypothetical protein
MDKPVLVIMAAGMGSRYGGLKQIDPLGPSGELIIDYSIYDAAAAGFKKVVFVIKREIERDFMSVIGDRIGSRVDAAFAFQELGDLPAGHSVPEGRTKPWGTTHALMAAAGMINGPFAAINSDDYYGSASFRTMYDHLASPKPSDGKAHFSMIGYMIGNTVTENGSVSRGICGAGEDGLLVSVTERLKVEKTRGGARFLNDDGAGWTEIPGGTLVSMNFWGFDKSFLERARAHFPEFLGANLPLNPLKCEYPLPLEVNRQMTDGDADVKVLPSSDKWYGITYKEDRAGVVDAIAQKHRYGLYPTPLWGA